MLKSPNSEILQLGISCLKNTKFYKDNQNQIVSSDYTFTLTLEETVDFIKTINHNNKYCSICIELFWKLVKDKYDTTGN